MSREKKRTQKTAEYIKTALRIQMKVFRADIKYSGQIKIFRARNIIPGTQYYSGQEGIAQSWKKE